jgi:hypothetical protein
MSTIEERLQAIEQEHSQLKKTIELQTIAIGALVNKAVLEKLNEKYDKIFDALMAHDSFTNGQLAELRTQQIETDGKVIGLQTEMRQRLNEMDSKMATKEDLAGIETRTGKIETRLDKVETLLTEILARLPKPQP